MGDSQSSQKVHTGWRGWVQLLQRPLTERFEKKIWKIDEKCGHSRCFQVAMSLQTHAWSERWLTSGMPQHL